MRKKEIGDGGDAEEKQQVQLDRPSQPASQRERVQITTIQKQKEIGKTDKCICCNLV